MQEDGVALINVDAHSLYSYPGNAPAEWITRPPVVAFPDPGGGTADVHDPPIGHQVSNVRLVKRYRADNPPGYVPNLKRLSVGPTEADVANDRALRPVTMSDTPKAELDAMIDAEASRRIVESYPEWMQRNATAHATHLTRVETGTSIDDQNNKQPARPLDANESAEEVLIADMWRWIQAVRQASDTIKQSPPANGNISGDDRWPPPPAQRLIQAARKL